MGSACQYLSLFSFLYQERDVILPAFALTPPRYTLLCETLSHLADCLAMSCNLCTIVLKWWPFVLDARVLLKTSRFCFVSAKTQTRKLERDNLPQLQPYKQRTRILLNINSTLFAS